MVIGGAQGGGGRGHHEAKRVITCAGVGERGVSPARAVASCAVDVLDFAVCTTTTADGNTCWNGTVCFTGIIA